MIELMEYIVTRSLIIAKKCIAKGQNRVNVFRQDFDEIKKTKRKYT